MTVPALTRDYSTKPSENVRVSFLTIPERAVAGMRTQLRVTLDPVDGLEKYLGAWFPRPQVYRVWVQLQREGIVNTVHFDVPVTELRRKIPDENFRRRSPCATLETRLSGISRSGEEYLPILLA
jgi:hypothetical protein